MIENLINTISQFIQVNVIAYLNELYQYPVKLISLILDLTIVIYLVYKFGKSVKRSRVGQLLKGIALFIVAVAVSDLLNLRILNFILTSIMTYGVIALIIIFQPELRRTLEQLGSNKFTRFFGIDKDVITKTKEDIYKIVIAATELSKTKTGRFNCNRKRNKNKRDYRNRCYFKCRSITTVIGKFVYSKYSFTRWSSYYK